MAAGEHWLTARVVDAAFASADSIPVLITGLGSVPVTLSPWGAAWRYRDTGIAPPANWATAAYSDTAWSTGAAELGYGDSDEMRDAWEIANGFAYASAAVATGSSTNYTAPTSAAAGFYRIVFAP